MIWLGHHCYSTKGGERSLPSLTLYSWSCAEIYDYFTRLDSRPPGDESSIWLRQPSGLQFQVAIDDGHCQVAGIHVQCQDAAPLQMIEQQAALVDQLFSDSPAVYGIRIVGALPGFLVKCRIADRDQQGQMAWGQAGQVSQQRFGGACPAQVREQHDQGPLLVMDLEIAQCSPIVGLDGLALQRVHGFAQLLEMRSPGSRRDELLHLVGKDQQPDLIAFEG